MEKSLAVLTSHVILYNVVKVSERETPKWTIVGCTLHLGDSSGTFADDISNKIEIIAKEAFHTRLDLFTTLSFNK